MQETIQEIFTDRIDDPAAAMRTDLNRDSLWELADNIKVNGLINPITVRPKGDRYEVVAGHRRLSACKIAGLIKINCVVRALDDVATFSIMAAENLEREDVDPVDEAVFITRYIAETKKTPEEVAKQLRRSVEYVKTRIAVGEMPDYMQAALKTGDIKLGVALALFKITDDGIRRMWTEMAARDGISVPTAEYWYQGWKLQQLNGGTPGSEPPAGSAAVEPRAVLFECAVDGKKYDARLMKPMFVYEGNLALFEAVVSEIRKAPVPA